MVAVVLGLGSNIEPQKHIDAAKKHLRGLFPSIVFSRCFESEAVGFNGDNFINLVACFKSTDLAQSGIEATLAALLQHLKAIERRLGRVHGSQKFSARSIDIDVLLFGDSCRKLPTEIPRGEIVENAYVLWPLSELLPTMAHPENGRTFAQLWREFDHNKQKLRPISE